MKVSGKNGRGKEGLVNLKGFSQVVRQLRQCLGALPDHRRGANRQYTMEDIGLAAFSVFFTQCPSFLAYQKAMQEHKGQSNAQTLFQIEKTPSDNHVRDMLDPLLPEELFPLYDCIYKSLEEQGMLKTFEGVQHTRLIALDGTWYFSSENIHCPSCSCLEHKEGALTYYHSAVTPVRVAPGHNQALPLRPEFISPQDGQTQQDCEINAGKRWLEKNGAFYQEGNTTLLGDDLYAHQPFCRRALLYGYHFIFVCKPDSHAYLYEWIKALEPGRDVFTLSQRVKYKNHWETHTYRYAQNVPLVEGADALKVHWCEVSLIDHSGRVRYHNTFITDWNITAENVAHIAASGRARWKIENENNNTLKTKGYHLEHNFGHGQQHLSSFLAALNILAFLCHAFLSFCDESYRLIRARLPTRKTFFQDLRALLRYLCFPSWEALLDFMMRGLEIGPYEHRSFVA